MKSISTATQKRLFALSGNCCAFPGCHRALVGQIVLGEIAHIHAQSRGGPRWNPELSEDEIQGFDNLILLCGDHHKEIDRLATRDKYPPSMLRKMKAEHEAKNDNQPVDRIEELFLQFLKAQEINNHVFQDAETYFSSFGKRLLEETIRQKGTYQTQLQTFQEFLLQQKKGILLLHGPGGQGKTHLLRDWVRIAKDEIEVKLIHSGNGNYSERFEKEIDPDKEHLFILDEAGKAQNRLPELLNLLRDKLGENRLILAFRSTSLHFITNEIHSNRLGSSIFSKIQQGNWKKKDLVQILRLASERDSLPHENRWASYAANPFLAAELGLQIKEQGHINIEDLQNEVPKGIVKNALWIVKEFVSNGATRKTESLLAFFAFVSPLNDKKIAVLKAISDITEISFYNLEDILQEWDEKGILVDKTNWVEFTSEMQKDLILSAYSKHIKPRYFEVLYKFSNKSISRNIQSAWLLSRSKTLQELAERVMEKMQAAFLPADEANWRELFTHLQPIGHIVPDQALQFINEFLDLELLGTPAIKKEATYSPRNSIKDNLLRIFFSIIPLPELREKLLRTFFRVDFSEFRENVSGHNPFDFVSDTVSWLKNSEECIQKTFSLISELTNPSSSYSAKLAASALNSIFSPGTTETSIDERVMREKKICYPLMEELITVRDVGLELLEKMIRSDKTELLFNAIEVVKNFWPNYRFSSLKVSDEFKKRIAEEREVSIKLIGEILPNWDEFSVISKIEKFLATTYFMEREGSEAAQEYLIRIPESVEYSFFKSFESHDIPVISYAAFISLAPKENRWHWYVDQTHWTEQGLPESYEKIHSLLSSTFLTPESIVKLLSKIELALGERPVNRNNPVWGLWVKSNPDLFLRIKKSKELWAELPERFQFLINRELRLNPEGLEILQNELLEILPDFNFNVFGPIMYWLGDSQTPEAEKLHWTRVIISRGEETVWIQLAGWLLQIWREYPAHYFHFLKDILIRIDSIPTSLIRSVNTDFQAFRNKITEQEDLGYSDCKREFLRLLVSQPIIGLESVGLFREWKFDLFELVSLFDERIQHGKTLIEDVSFHFQAVPDHAEESFSSTVKSIEDLRFLVDKIFEWRDSVGFEVSLESGLWRDIGGLPNEEGEAKWLNVLITEFLENKEWENLFFIATYLKHIPENIPLYAKIIEAGIAESKEKGLYGMLGELFNRTTVNAPLEPYESQLNYISKMVPYLGSEASKWFIEKELKRIKERMEVWGERFDD